MRKNTSNPQFILDKLQSQKKHHSMVLFYILFYGFIYQRYYEPSVEYSGKIPKIKAVTNITKHVMIAHLIANF